MAFQLPPIMGHRGAAGLAPENTLAGIRALAALGLDWVEFDVMLTGDDVVVLFHDDSLERITGHDALMAETPYARLRRLDAGARFDAAFAGEPVPRFAEAMALLAELGLKANVEIKPTKGREVETATAALAAINADWPASLAPPMICSFERACLEVAQRTAPTLPRAFVAWELPQDWRGIAESLACVSLHLNHDFLTPDIVAEVKAAGYAVAAYTVNEPDEARTLTGMGVDCIITDFPDAVARALEVPTARV